MVCYLVLRRIQGREHCMKRWGVFWPIDFVTPEGKPFAMPFFGMYNTLNIPSVSVHVSDTSLQKVELMAELVTELGKYGLTAEQAVEGAEIFIEESVREVNDGESHSKS